MSRRIGRPLKTRTDAERIALLVKLAGYGRNRKHVGLFWAGAEIELRICLHPQSAAFPTCDDEYTIIASGPDIGTALDRAISQHAERLAR